MSDSIFEVEYRPGEEVVLRFKSPRLRGLPDSTRRHLLAGGREALLALRDILDRAIEKAEKPEKTPRKKRTKIKVQ
ncbi:MAG: hypothetical protein IMY77_05010 [Chloroflexi bacterium]|nr:hypothetical protein [Chloroflexota bacterium]